MTLKLYNTLTRTKEEFKPLDRQNVRMYVCGPTVYDYAHIGNARPVIVFDVLFRLLRHLYGAEHVTYVRNITDIDDKINARAKEEGTSIRELTERTYSQFREDTRGPLALGALEPTYEPRATDFVDAMKEIIERLIASGHAYVADGHVLFSVPSMKDYGQLSRRPLDEMIAGARVDVAPYKRDAMDFVLWKPSDSETPGWESPWGRGRPGWHIECSAMSWKHLGEVFDIHGGGIDLVFPHHENELAQTRCAFGHGVMANTWMHNGFLQVEGQKMSKSLGNFVTINEVLKDWPGEVVRLNMLRTHYRQPIDWTLAGLVEAQRTLRNWSTWALEHEMRANMATFQGNWPQPSAGVLEALLDDLNTPLALTRIHEAASEAHSNPEVAWQLFSDAAFLGVLNPKALWVHQSTIVGTVRGIGRFYDDVQKLKVAIANSDSLQIEEIVHQLRMNGAEPKWTKAGFVSLDRFVGNDKGKIEELVNARLAARKAKNWAESDRIRDELLAMGIVLKDNKDGTTSWEVKR
jgi:cysteinyl-tRNA synthetase